MAEYLSQIQGKKFSEKRYLSEVLKENQIHDLNIIDGNPVQRT